MTAYFENVSEALPPLARSLLKARKVGSRNGETRECLMVPLSLARPLERVVVNDARKCSVPAQIAETAWVLAGRNDVEWLSHYLPRAKEFSDDGKVWRGAYGPRIRRWGGMDPAGDWRRTDQLRHVVDLLKEDPATRRAVISIYDPAIDTAPGKDIPCNNWLSFVARDGVLHLHVATRSNDLIWGWSGINQFEWSVLLEVVAGLTGLKVGELHFSITSLHLYAHHYTKAERIAATVPSERAWLPDPRFAMKSFADFNAQLRDFFRVERILREEPEKDWTRQVADMNDPMLRSWLQVLGWWWSGNEAYMDPLVGTALYYGVMKSPNRPSAPAQLQNKMSIAIAELHQRKDKAYGDSWKRRGEQVGIQANIARKVDRLGTAGDQDETALDTAIDLLVYLLKYEAWLDEQAGATGLGTEDDRVRRGLARLEKNGNDAITTPDADYCQNLDNRFTDLLQTWHGPMAGPRVADQGGTIPAACEKCNATLAECDEKLAVKGRTCCKSCKVYDTHKAQDGRQRLPIVRGMIAEAWDLCSLRWAESQRSTDAAEMRRQLWKQGNETRSWNPEAGQ